MSEGKRMRKNSREEEGDHEEEKLRLGVRLGRSGNAELQKMIRKGEEERECVRGCSERESEIAREIGREKIET